MSIDASWGTLIGVIVGAAAGVAGAVITSLITKRSDERKHLMSLAYEAGLKTWSLHCEIAEKAAANGKKVGVDPLEVYVLNSLLCLQILGSGKTDEATIIAKWRKVDSLAKTIHAEIRAEVAKRQTP